jgi:hypothetical protein
MSQHQLFCNICSEVAYEFSGLGDPHVGVESTCPGCGAKGSMGMDCEDGQVYAYWTADKGEWPRMLEEQVFTEQCLEVGYGGWKELFYVN